jgi:hypothetical protein
MDVGAIAEREFADRHFLMLPLALREYYDCREERGGGRPILTEPCAGGGV